MSKAGLTPDGKPVSQVDAILQGQQILPLCSFVRTNGEHCGEIAWQGTGLCKLHYNRSMDRRISGKTIRSGPYSKFLDNSPELTRIFGEVSQQESQVDTTSEIAQMRTMLVRFMEVHSQKLENGDPVYIKIMNDFITSLSDVVSKAEGKRYSLSLSGVEMVIQQVVAILKRHLEDQPELLQKIAVDLTQIKLPPGSLGR